MSEQHITDQVNGPDDSKPTAERQAELRQLSKANLAVGKPPYAGMQLASRGELNWILSEQGRKTPVAGIPNTYADLRSAGFAGDFRNANLEFANLGNSWIENANFAGAELSFSNLSGAFILEANFNGAEMIGVDLSRARIIDADFSGANLTATSLADAAIQEADGATIFDGADLRFVNLSGATVSGSFRGTDLTSARLDAVTVLGGYTERGNVRLDTSTQLLDVSWNGANLALVDWNHVRRLGDERKIKEASSRTERVLAYQDAARSYRGLAKALEAQGFTAAALRYRTRQHQLERGAALRAVKFGQWSFSSLLNIVSGYGDKPGRALAVYLTVIGLFAATFLAVTAPTSPIFYGGSQPLEWYEAIVLSLSSFHGRGFFPSDISLGNPVAVVAALEAVIGLFIELVLIATFTQRFFAR